MQPAHFQDMVFCSILRNDSERDYSMQSRAVVGMSVYLPVDCMLARCMTLICRCGQAAKIWEHATIYLSSP